MNLQETILRINSLMLLFERRANLSTQEFIKRAKEVHDKKRKDQGLPPYDYSDTEYQNQKDKVTVNCPLHGPFQVLPGNHIRRESGCPKCGTLSAAKKQRKEEETFLKQAEEKNKDRVKKGLPPLDFSQTKYVNATTPIQVICPIHGKLPPTIPHNILTKGGCKQCGYDKLSKDRRRSQDEFIRLANEKHHNKFDYSQVDYQGDNVKVVVRCPKHDYSWSVKPYAHLSGQGCPKCSESKGESIVAKILNQMGWEYERNKIFEGCVGDPNEKGKCFSLKYDFYIPSEKIVIEYDGIQHSKPVEAFGGAEAFEKAKRYDEIKNRYAKSRGLKMIRIPHTFKEENSIKKEILDKI